MTDKEQIIIDGVDVSGCRYGEIEKDVFKCSCEYNVRSASMFCKDNPNCHYKLYKRKEQEYEELRQYHNKCCEEFEKEKQNLIDRYNQFSKDFFIGKYCKKEYCDLLKAKEQECEELKRKLSNQEQLYQNEIEIYNESCLQLRQENDDLYLERLALNTANSGINSLLEIKEQENDRYRKALEEIEEYAKENDEMLQGYHHEWANNRQILEIINKAKGEGNGR